jgi:hypothetical protein
VICPRGSNAARRSHAPSPPTTAEPVISRNTSDRRRGHRCPSVRCPLQWGQVAIRRKASLVTARTANLTYADPAETTLGVRWTCGRRSRGEGLASPGARRRRRDRPQGLIADRATPQTAAAE